MRTVSSAAAYNADKDHYFRPSPAHEYEPPPPPAYHTPSRQSDPATRFNIASHSPSPTRPLLSSLPSDQTLSYGSPTRRFGGRETHEQDQRPSPDHLQYPPPTQQVDFVSDSQMAGQGSGWRPDMSQASYEAPFRNVPPPPPHSRAQGYYAGDRSHPQGYHPDDRQQYDHQMDHRYEDTSYHGYAGNPHYDGHDRSYDAHHNGYAPYHQPSNPSLRENHFNRRSFYDSGAYPEISPSPARHSRPEFDEINPHFIADEDDPRDYSTPVRDNSARNRLSKIPVIGAAALGSGSYASVGQNASTQRLDTVHGAGVEEKAAWRDIDEHDRKKRKMWIWIAIIVVLLLVAGGVAAGVVLGLRKNSSGSSGGSSAPGMSSSSNGLNANSKEIKALMNNKNLHKVFPVMDYTPYKTQMPYCVGDPPSQDNITMDMAILSQLTPAVRVYGTDCNQTELILTAIDRLGIKDSMKIWLGVWIDTNTTTNQRQMDQMYSLLDKYGADPFKGLIIGNEALFRKDITEAGLVSLLNSVKSNLTSKGINLSVSTSDLGSAWTANLASASDHVMGNIHPFFAGIQADQAASWTYTFWQTNDVAVAPEPSTRAAGAPPRNIISETGWPSAGGNDCGSGANCAGTTDGSVAGVDEMNRFMNDWVCQANNNGTMYFWFEAFDEPWKVVYNTDKEQWEDKWGLMGIDRKLKTGVKIPDCGGKTVS